MGLGDLSLARKRALIQVLTKEPDLTLAELAQRFGVSWTDIRDDIYQISTVELSAGAFYDLPFDVWFDEDEPDENSVVRVVNVASEVAPALSGGEVVSLLAALDVALLSASEADRDTLTHMRERIVSAATEAGYGESLWAAPQLQAGADVTATIGQALAERRMVDIVYWKNDGEGPYSVTRTISPISITYVPYPLLLAEQSDGQVRNFRFDRITQVTMRSEEVSQRLIRRVTSRSVPSTEVSGQLIRLWCDAGARWVVEEIPQAKLRAAEDELVIDLPLRSVTWLLSLLVRLGDSVHRMARVEEVEC